MAKKKVEETGGSEWRPKPPRESSAEKKKRFTRVMKILGQLYPDAKCALDFENPYELTVATILSAQCTDERVNQVMKDFRKKYPTAHKLANAKLEELEKTIQSTGFFRQKSKSLKSMANDVLEKFNGKIPKTMDELTTLRGVGRKTANVVMGNAFGIAEGIAVDTHVTRLSGRLAFSENLEPEKIEQDLMQLAPKEEWVLVSHRLILHGRAICQAKKPRCSECDVAEYCPSAGMPGSI
jgi:endonuclease III